MRSYLFFCLIGLAVAADICLPSLAARYGQAAQGKIIKLAKIPDGRHGLTYPCAVEYPGPQGASAYGAADIPAWYFSETQVGQPVALHYLTLFPMRISLDACPNSQTMLLVVVLIVAFLACRWTYPFWRESRLMVHGLPVKAEVKSAQHVKNATLYQAQYEFDGSYYNLKFTDEELEHSYATSGSQRSQPLKLTGPPQTPAASTRPPRLWQPL